MPGSPTNAIYIVVPTYNEAGNLESLVREVLAQDDRLRVLVVDDASPDGTGEIAERLARETGRVDVVHRPGKLGLGTAYIAGFKRAMELGAEFVGTMDADGSHDPRSLPAFIATAARADVVVGSRYLRGVSVINWPMQRILLSWFANRYVRFITGLKLTDCTSGYRLYRRDALASIRLDSIKSRGYAFLVEIAFRTHKLGWRLAEVPIVFYERRQGRSKMSRGVILEAAVTPWRLALGGRRYARRS
ncbi:MAG: polyprenol monophosphomannose synthase [Armatimonadota bacterium]|nr:MAG: polyprenol monophosphomannose synthase [Armatimonadota bacterium]